MAYSMTHAPTNWGLREFSDQAELRLEWAGLRIRLIRRGHDLLLVEVRDDKEIVQLDADPDSDFRRYAFEQPIRKLGVTPRVPDRPVVVQPLHPLRLAPGAEVDFYVSIPVDIQLSIEQREKLELLERIRSEVLSDTWFGDPISGLLCYALKSRARREKPAAEDILSNRAICKIRIHNKSTDQLHCTKFCLRLEHCHLWQNGQSLWTSPVSIRYNGKDQLSAIDYSGQEPAELHDALKIAEAEEPPATGLIRRTFTSLGTALT